MTSRGLPFLEAIRQFSNEIGKKNTLFIHLTLVPYMKASDEIKPNLLNTLLRNLEVLEYSLISLFVGLKDQYLLIKEKRFHYFVMFQLMMLSKQSMLKRFMKRRLVLIRKN